MEFGELIGGVIRWLHIAAGMLFIGLVWWSGIIASSFEKLVAREQHTASGAAVLSRYFNALRWSGRITWILGLLLLIGVFYRGGLMFETEQPWSTVDWVLVALVFFSFPIYDALARSPIGRNGWLLGAVALVLLAVLVTVMVQVGQFTYRAYVIHVGVMFGTIMLANIERTRREQKRLLESLNADTPPDATGVVMIAQRLRHNASLSIPLLWTMIDAHTVVPAADSLLYLLGAILVGWLVAALIQALAGRKG